MTNFDSIFLHLLNQFAQKSWIFDASIYLLATTNLLKGGILISILWWYWFKPSEHQTKNREIIISSYLGALVSLSIARLFVQNLYFRLRPLHNPKIEFTLPYEMNSQFLDGWSSFPSDHAALFFTIAVCIFFISKMGGIVSFCYVLIFISLPRVYLGLHYMSDIVGGAIIGTMIALLFNSAIIKNCISRPIYAWSKKYPQVFYACFFILSYQVGTNFDDFRKITKFLLNILTGYYF